MHGQIGAAWVPDLAPESGEAPDVLAASPEFTNSVQYRS